MTAESARGYYRVREENTMTLAIDRRTGAIVGQVTTVRRDGEDKHLAGCIVLLTAKGYRAVDAASVRLERTRD